MWDWIIKIIVGLIIGFLAGKPVWNKFFLSGGHFANWFLSLKAAVQEDSEKGKDISDAEWIIIKEHWEKGVNVWK